MFRIFTKSIHSILNPQNDLEHFDEDNTDMVTRGPYGTDQIADKVIESGVR